MRKIKTFNLKSLKYARNIEKKTLKSCCSVLSLLHSYGGHVNYLETEIILHILKLTTKDNSTGLGHHPLKLANWKFKEYPGQFLEKS